MKVGSVVDVAGNMYPTVSVTVTGDKGIRSTIEVTLDTGFTGSLSLPARIDQSSWTTVEYIRDRAVTLADGSQRDAAIYRGSG